jgi:hypothetical protein
MKSRIGQRQREERRVEEKESEERRCRCETLCFSNDLRLRRVEE